MVHGGAPIASELGVRPWILLVFGTIVGILAFSLSRRIVWVGFLLLSAFSVAQASVLDFPWPKREEGVIFFVAHTAMWLLLPCIVWAYANTPRVRHLIRISFIPLGVINYLTFVLWLSKSSVGITLAPYAPYVMDSSGINENASRFSGTLNSPNALALLAIVTWPAFLSPIRAEWCRFYASLLRIISLALIYVMVFFTYSRAAYLGLIVQFCFLAPIVFAQSQGSSKRAADHAFLALGLACVIAVLVNSVRQRVISAFSGGTDASILNRLEVYSVALRLLWERPFCGWGPGSFAHLYNVFYRIPGVNYAFHDVHSAFFSRFLDIGFAGICLEVILLLGLSPFKNVKRVPLWVRLSFVGAIVPSIAENASRVTFAVDIAWIWIAAVVVIYTRGANARSNKCDSDRTRSLLFTCACSGLWLMNFVVEPKNACDRLNAELNRLCSSLVGKTTASVYISDVGTVWRSKEEREFPSVIASMLLLSEASVAKPETMIDLVDFRPVPAMERNVPIILKAPEAAAYLLYASDPLAAQRLVDLLPADLLREVARRDFRCEPFHAVAAENFCPTCALYEIPRQREFVGRGLRTYATTATISQVANAFAKILETTTSAVVPIRTALADSRDEWGMLRHLGGVGSVWGLSFYSGPKREEIVAIPLTGGGQLVLAMEYEARQSIPARVDSAANKVFALTAWRCWCVLQAEGEETFVSLAKRNPAGRDILRELQDYCTRHGVRHVHELIGAAQPPW
jgi:O-antigen ligase